MNGSLEAVKKSDRASTSQSCLNLTLGIHYFLFSTPSLQSIGNEREKRSLFLLLVESKSSWQHHFWALCHRNSTTIKYLQKECFSRDNLINILLLFLVEPNESEYDVQSRQWHLFLALLENHKFLQIILIGDAQLLPISHTHTHTHTYPPHIDTQTRT